MIEKIKIPEDEVLNIERLNFEYMTLKDNVCFLIDSHRNDVSFLESEIFKEYFKKEVEVFKKYELSKKELEKKYILSKYDQQVTWSLDFSTDTLTLVID